MQLHVVVYVCCMTHVNGCLLSECPYWVNVIEEDRGSHHYTHTEQSCLFVLKPRAIAPVK